jgi:hypothetical protein
MPSVMTNPFRMFFKPRTGAQWAENPPSTKID